MKDQILQLADHLSGRLTIPDGVGQLASNAISLLLVKITASASVVSEPTTRAVLVDFASLLNSQSIQIQQNTFDSDWTLFFKVAASLEATGDGYSISTATMIREFANSQGRQTGPSKKGEAALFWFGVLYILFGFTFWAICYAHSAKDKTGGGWFAEIVGILVLILTVVVVASSDNGGP